MNPLARNRSFGLAALSLALLSGGQAPKARLPEMDELFDIGAYTGRKGARSKYKPHDGAWKAERERRGWQTKADRQMNALQSMLAKGLQPRFTNGWTSGLACGNLKRFPMDWLTTLEYKGLILNPWGPHYDFGQKAWVTQYSHSN